MCGGGRSFSSGLLTGWYICAWTWWQWFDFYDCDSAADSDTSTYCAAFAWRRTILVIMPGLGQGSDMTSLRRRWPKAVFNTLRRRASDVERLRRDAPKRADKAFRYSGPGFCGVCDTRIYSALDAHMIADHLELGQLWRCPVTWCVVWKGFFPPWTVTRDVWLAALRPDLSGVAVDALLFHEAGRRLVHRYRVYKDPFTHLALRDGVIPRLLSCVGRAMAIARLTHLRVSIPSSGATPSSSLVAAACRSWMRSP